MGNRDSTIDIAKGICIFLMVLGHTYFYSSFNDRVYLFHMPFFFFVSGFFFSCKKDIKDFFIDKTSRLLIPMLIYWVFGILLSLPMAFRSGTLPNLDIGALWFLLSLWTIFIMAYISTKFLKAKIANLIVGIILMVIAYYLNIHKIQIPCHFVQSLFMFPLFILGKYFYHTEISFHGENMSLYQLLLSKRKLCISVALIGVFILICGNLSYLNVEKLIVPSPLSLFVGAFSGILLVLAISKLITLALPKIANTLDNLGKKSLHVLGFHFAILQLLYFIGIPFIMRLECLWGSKVYTGEEIKQDMPLFGLFLAVIATWVSYHIGVFVENKWPFLWGIKNKSK